MQYDKISARLPLILAYIILLLESPLRIHVQGGPPQDVSVFDVNLFLPALVNLKAIGFCTVQPCFQPLIYQNITCCCIREVLALLFDLGV